ncbi:hypothetical protein D1007_57802 [Hordeum vulgare]|nr:hypothetical protein D1007_57802 [Hordeum vulgare]
METPTVPLHIHALLSGVLSPFSRFFIAVLPHSQIHALHLDPGSLVLLSAFGFLCEAFVGVTPSIALLFHFFSLELVSEEQCSGCASLKTANALIPGALDIELIPEAMGFRRQWVQVDTAEAGVLFQPSLAPATPNQEWGCEQFNDPRLTPVLTRLGKLKRAGVTMAMVVREFICRWIAPLQRHSHPMWANAEPSDPMRTQVLPLSPHVLHELLRRLTGDDPDELPQNGLPLYNFKARKLSLSIGDKGGGSAPPAPEITQHLVVSTLAARGVQPPQSLAREPPTVFLARGLRLPRGVPLPSPAAPPKIMLRLPSRTPLLGDVGPQGALPSDEEPAREPRSPEHGFGPRASSRASPVHHVESESSCWPLEPVGGSRSTPWGLLRTVLNTLQRLGAGLASNEVRLEDERRYLASGWRQLEVSMNLGRLQRERTYAEAEKSLVGAKEARERALSEAQEADF